MTSSCACSPPARVTGRVASTSPPVRRPAGCAARSAHRRNRGCAASPGPAPASPAGRPGALDVLHGHVARDPLVAHGHDVDRHPQLAISAGGRIERVRLRRPAVGEDEDAERQGLTEPRRELLQGPPQPRPIGLGTAGPAAARRPRTARGRTRTSGSRADDRPAAGPRRGRSAGRPPAPGWSALPGSCSGIRRAGRPPWAAGPSGLARTRTGLSKIKTSTPRAAARSASRALLRASAPRRTGTPGPADPRGSRQAQDRTGRHEM